MKNTFSLKRETKHTSKTKSFHFKHTTYKYPLIQKKRQNSTLIWALYSPIKNVFSQTGTPLHDFVSLQSSLPEDRSGDNMLPYTLFQNGGQ